MPHSAAFIAIFAALSTVCSAYIFDAPGMGERYYSFMNPLPLRLSDEDSLTAIRDDAADLELSVEAMGRDFPRPIIVPASLIEAHDDYSAEEDLVQTERVQRDLAASSFAGENIKRGVKLMRLARMSARGFGK